MPLTPEQIAQYRAKYGIGSSSSFATPQPVSNGYSLRETATDVYEGVNAIGGAFKDAGQRIFDRETTLAPTGKVAASPAERVVGFGADLFRGGSRAVGEGIKGIAKVLSPQSAEDAVGGAVEAAGQAVGQTRTAQDLYSRYQSLSPDIRAQFDNVLGYAEGAADLITGGIAGKGAKTAINAASDAASATKRGLGTVRETLFSRPATTVDDAIEQADSAMKTTRMKAEAETPDLTIKEKWIGLQPDIKKRITGKQDKLQEYFDVAHARNADDTVPSPYEYGAQQAQKAVDAMEANLSETGGKIGSFRNKIGTYTASPDAINQIEKTFANELSKLNLEIRNGAVREKPGKVRVTGGSKDASVLNDLYNEIKVVKQSPNLTNLIDLRSAFDGKINFAKQAREASSSIDPVSRQVRKSIADTAAQVVGKSEAGELAKYSEFMDAYSDLRSYTDRRAGGEYLLRLVLSGRGGEARQIISTIKEYTGIDLMDDATMMTLATDFVGNSRQKNLFRQEMTKAGLDAASILKGDTGGASGLAGTVFNWAVDKALDEEKILLNAAKGAKASPQPGQAPKPQPARTEPVSSPKPTTGQRIKQWWESMPGKEGGYINIGGKEVRAIDAASKKELTNLVDYLQSGKGIDNDMEYLFDLYTERFGISPDTSNAKIAAQLIKILENTKTKPMPGSAPKR